MTLRDIAAFVAAASFVVGCGADGGSVEEFCAAVGDLRARDPFAELDVATGEEMREAFDDLARGVDEIADAAPAEAEAQADRYREAVDELIDQLRGAGFDLRRLDRLAYRSATETYDDARRSVENTADAICE